jgi:dodecin
MEVLMTVEKHLKLTGISNISWKDAITKTILEASKSIDYISSVNVLEQKAKIDGNKIIEYYSTIELTFNVDSTRE